MGFIQQRLLVDCPFSAVTRCANTAGPYCMCVCACIYMYMCVRVCVCGCSVCARAFVRGRLEDWGIAEVRDSLQTHARTPARTRTAAGK